MFLKKSKISNKTIAAELFPSEAAYLCKYCHEKFVMSKDSSKYLKDEHILERTLRPYGFTLDIFAGKIGYLKKLDKKGPVVKAVIREDIYNEFLQSMFYKNNPKLSIDQSEEQLEQE